MQYNIVVYTEFTDEEQAIKKELMKKYFSTDVEKAKQLYNYEVYK